MIPYESWAIANPGTVEDYLLSLGAPPEVVDFVTAQPEELHSKLANEVRKGVQSVEELEAYLERLPGKRALTPAEAEWVEAIVRRPGEQAHALRRTPAWRMWLTREALRHRGGQWAEAMPVGVAPTYSRARPGMTDVTYVRDWIHNQNVELASYTWETAMEAAAEWHEACARQGEGEVYDGSEVEVFRWPDGWRLVRIVSKNDLVVEGNRMGHCVSSYARSVMQGESIIWSLRDTRNAPHVTIEIHPTTSPAHGEVTQIQGKGDREPVIEYRDRLASAFEQAKFDGLRMSPEHDPWRELAETDWRNFCQFTSAVIELLDATGSERNEYGIKQESTVSIENFFSLHDHAVGQDRYARYDEDVAVAVGAAAYRQDRRSFPRATFAQVSAMSGEHTKQVGQGGWRARHGTREKPLSEYGLLEHRREYEDNAFFEWWAENEHYDIEAWRQERDHKEDYEAWQERGGDYDDMPKDLRERLDENQDRAYRDSENHNQLAGEALVEYERLAVEDGWLKKSRRQTG